MQVLRELWESSDIIWMLAWREVRHTLKRKIFWIGVLFPVIAPLIIMPMAFFAFRAKSRTLYICYEKDVSNFAETVNKIVTLPEVEDNDMRYFSSELKACTPKEMDAARLALSQQIRDGKLMGFLEIRKAPRGGVPELHLFTEPMNTDAVSLKQRLKGGLLFLGSFQFDPDIRLDPAGLEAHYLFEHTPIREESETGDGIKNLAGSMGRSFVVLLLSMVVSFNIQLATGPLRVGLSKEKESRFLEVLLTAFTVPELILSRYISTMLIGMSVISFYGALVLFPACTGGLLSVAFAMWFVLFAFSTLILEAAIAFVVGAIAKDQKDANRLSGPLSIISLMGSMGIVVLLQVPNSGFAKYLSYVPNLAGSLCPARIALLKTIPWQDVATSYALLNVSAFYVVWLTFRLFRADLLLGNKRPPWKVIIPFWKIPRDI